MQNLRISLVQTHLDWQQPDANRERLTALLAPLEGQTDLIVLPEMFTTGFTMSPNEVAEPMQGPTLAWMQAQARLLGAAICGSVVIEDAGYRNRLLFVTPEGEVEYYDKHHLFRMANEHEYYAAGTRRSIIEYKGWRILPQVCYDLRFPVWCRNRDDYDVLLCVANWPSPRRMPWRTLLLARAIENQCYVVGVNRVGEDGKGLEYSGDSLLVDFKGQALLDGPAREPFIKTGLLNGEDLKQFRHNFPVWQDADAFTLSDMDETQP
ncbi:putative amidohydrolase [Marinobacterium halophilum]|uniref:Omega-amidase YafV n=1 Tax=Marinobacterium halophilum TaxID=267374 RepID=A0A2P8EK15_9GAMM|nr:amidohydrolase [Marinobacterium halophilum]PSL09798.1 putative amidohydrolase [Marinobacterium halophilum]